MHIIAVKTKQSYEPTAQNQKLRSLVNCRIYLSFYI